MMRTLLEKSDDDYLQLLDRQGEAKIEDFCTQIGVTPTAVRQRLARLQDMGLIARVSVRGSRGRPYHQYVLTSDGRRALGEDYAELAILLWETLQQIEDPFVREQVRQQVSDRFVKRLGGEMTQGTLKQKLQALDDRLRSRGFQAELVSDAQGELVLRENHCPYHELAVHDRGICHLERDVFQRILGNKLELVHTCHDGAGCCEFRPVESTLSNGLSETEKGESTVE